MEQKIAENPTLLDKKIFADYYLFYIGIGANTASTLDDLKTL